MKRYVIDRKYYRQLADYGYLNYADEFRKRDGDFDYIIHKKTGLYTAYQGKFERRPCTLMGIGYDSCEFYVMETLTTPPDLPVEWWRKEEGK